MRCLVADTDSLGECPTWDETTGRLNWIDVTGKKMSSCKADGSDLVRQDVGDYPGSFALRSAGGRLVAFRRSLGLFDAAGAQLAKVDPDNIDMEQERFNDGAADTAGRFWVGTMDRRLQGPKGALYRVDPDLSIHRMDTGFGISNGISWSPDDSRLYHCDSAPSTIYVHDFDRQSGTISNKRVFVTFEPDMGKADGSAMDVEGFLWVAAPGTGDILRFDPDGKIERRLKTPVICPSSLCFGGADLKNLFITSLVPPMGERQPLDGAVFAADLDIAGAPCGRFGG